MKKVCKSITALLIMLSLCAGYSLNMDVHAQENETDDSATTEMGIAQKPSNPVPAVTAYEPMPIRPFAMVAEETFTEGDFTYTYLGELVDEDGEVYKYVELTSLDSSESSITMPVSVEYEGETYYIISIADTAFDGKTVNEIYLEDIFSIVLFSDYTLAGATPDTGIIEFYAPGFTYERIFDSQTIEVGTSVTFEVTIIEYINLQVANYSIADNTFEFIDTADAKEQPYEGEEFIPEIEWYNDYEIIEGETGLTYTMTFDQEGTYVISATLYGETFANEHTITVVTPEPTPVEPGPVEPTPVTPTTPVAPATATDSDVVATGDATSSTMYLAAAMAAILVAYASKRKTSTN